MVGREAELESLTDWITRRHAGSPEATVLTVLQRSGAGKSALTWKWFVDVVEDKWRGWTGRLWWSFQGRDASFELFVVCALAYVSGISEDSVLELSPSEREDRLWSELDNKRVLLVLDGVERLLVAHGHVGAACTLDPPRESPHSRFCSDVRVGAFLRRLTRVRASSVLVSTCIRPAELENCRDVALFNVPEITDDAAFRLWLAFGGRGSREDLLPLFRGVRNHPMALRVLARLGALTPAREDAVEEALEIASSALGDAQREVLQTVAALVLPPTVHTLRTLIVGEGKACADDPALDIALAELELQGLVGRDSAAALVDIHPLVRKAVWRTSDDCTRRKTLTLIRDGLEATTGQDELTIDLFHSYVALNQDDDAFKLFFYRLRNADLTGRERIELLDLLLTKSNSVPQPPEVMLHALSAAAIQSERSFDLARVIQLVRKSLTMDDDTLASGWATLSRALWLSGELRAAEAAVLRQLQMARQNTSLVGRAEEVLCLKLVGVMLAARGDAQTSESALRRALARSSQEGQGSVTACLAQQQLLLARNEAALSLSARAFELAQGHSRVAESVRAARIHGEAALALGDLAAASGRLAYAIAQARTANLRGAPLATHVEILEDEMAARVLLAEVHRQQGANAAALATLDDVWPFVERVPLRLLHADACNVLAQIERDEGNRAGALDAATRAFKLAWCDGPPYAYASALRHAQAHLQDLEAASPDCPPFDPSRHDPLPEVDLDPRGDL